MAQMVEILPNGMVGSVYLTQSMLWLLMSCRHKEPGKQQPWYWPYSLICLGLSTRGVNFWWPVIIICWLWFYKGLTYCGSDKMAAILQTTFSTLIFFYENNCILFKIPLKFVSVGPIENMSELPNLLIYKWITRPQFVDSSFADFFFRKY